jgi:hypothetical protein
MCFFIDFPFVNLFFTKLYNIEYSLSINLNIILSLVYDLVVLIVDVLIDWIRLQGNDFVAIICSTFVVIFLTFKDPFYPKMLLFLFLKRFLFFDVLYKLVASKY